MTNSSRIVKISILNKKGSLKKFLQMSGIWVGRRKEPILGYAPKNDEKKNSGSKELKTMNVWLRPLNVITFTAEI